jgi:hypothetical protein
MIIIRHQAGPLAGKEQKIEGKSERIIFGRDPDFCDVVYPADATLVARRHFALVKKPSGEWTFDLFGDLFVAMDGQPVDEAQAVRNGGKIELGRRGGPAFTVEIAGEELGDKLPVTATQEEVEGAHAAAAHALSSAAAAGRSATSARHYAVVGLLLALVVGGVAAGIYYLGRSEGARLAEAVANLAEEQRRAAAQTIGAAAKDKLTQGSYLVIIRFANGSVRPVGTGTPIAPDLLGTNAHIAELFPQLEKDQRMFVRAPGHDGRVFEVIEARKHPGYDAFTEFLKKDPIFVVGSGSCAKCELPRTLSGSFSYDVGTLRVAAGSNMAPILEVADREELANLKVGSPLAAAGYPMDNIAGAELLAFAPTPTLSVGIVTALTDMFNVPSDFQHRFLIHHNLPITGGSSGSPIIGPSGKIVGFVNASSVYAVPTNVVPSGHIPNAALINFAQRAELLSDMLADGPTTNLDAERAYWEKMTEAFKRGIDVLVPAIVAVNTPKGTNAELIERKQFKMTEADRTTLKSNQGEPVTARRQRRPLQVTAGRQYLFVAYAKDRIHIQLYLFVNGKVVSKDEEHDWYPFLGYKAEENGTVELNLLSEDKDVTYTLFQYAWTGAPSS